MRTTNILVHRGHSDGDSLVSPFHGRIVWTQKLKWNPNLLKSPPAHPPPLSLKQAREARKATLKGEPRERRKLAQYIKGEPRGRRKLDQYIKGEPRGRRKLAQYIKGELRGRRKLAQYIKEELKGTLF